MFMGFWLCYQTSQKAVLGTPGKLEAWARDQRKNAPLLGVILLLGGLWTCMLTLGVGAGAFGGLMILTVIASLVVLLAPLGLVTIRSVSMVIGACALLEGTYYYAS